MRWYRKEKGITLITLVITIIILGILIFTVTMNIEPYANEKTKTNFETDIRRIEEQVTQYYTRIGNIPIINKYEPSDELKAYKNVNDNSNYYVIDLEKLELKLYYGKDYKTIKEEPITKTITETDNLSDVYIINEQSNTIYYAKGIEYDERKHYRLDEIYNEIDVNQGANAPILVTGMTPIKFTTPTDSNKGEVIKTLDADPEWYDYGETADTKKWANAQTQDGSMWVWIPRYAYRINETTRKIEIKFLIGTTDKYIDNDGIIKTAQRANENNLNPTTTGQEYTVHPAFTNEKNIDFNNGGWKYEISGFWAAKFEAGYASGNNTAEVKESSVYYSASVGTVAAVESTTGSQTNLTVRNWLDGIYGTTKTKIKYPTFQPLTYSMGYITINDAYKISRALTEDGNIYGLNTSTADSHLMKNSEWGAIAYLTQSMYGQNGTELAINNASLNSGGRQRTQTAGKTGVDSVYTVTGCTDGTSDGGEKITTIEAINGVTGNTPNANGVYTWNQITGTNASTTGNMYGIYDMSGGLWEKTATFISNGSAGLNANAQALLAETKASGAKTGTSTAYATIYPYVDTGSDNNAKGQSNYANYELNSGIFGDGIREVTDSTAGTSETNWNTSGGRTLFGYNDESIYPGGTKSIFVRGGRWYHKTSQTAIGLYALQSDEGTAFYGHGFRPVIIAAVQREETTEPINRLKGNTVKLTLDSQESTTPGTTEVYYKYYEEEKYYSDSACTAELSNNKITLPTKIGYTFAGYYITKNEKEKQYINSDGTFINVIYKEISKDATLHAKWKGNTYTVEFNANGGSGGQIQNVTATYGQGMPEINKTAPIKEGYTFMGWYDNADYTKGTQYYTKEGNSTKNYNKTAETTLYAGWSINKYTLAINPNGGTFNGKTANTTVEQDYNSNYSVANNPTKPGYIFTGWTLTGSGKSTYYDTSVTPTETKTFNYNSSSSTLPNAYNNAGGGTVTREMVADSTATGGYSLKVTTNGKAAPGAGGVHLNAWPAITDSPTRINVLEVKAKIPTGYNLQLAGIGQPYTGINSAYKYNENAGTGAWKTYYFVVYFGDTGIFSQTAYLHLNGSNNTSVTWNINSIVMKSYTREQFKTVYTFGNGEGTLTAEWKASGSGITYNTNSGTFDRTYVKNWSNGYWSTSDTVANRIYTYNTVYSTYPGDTQYNWTPDTRVTSRKGYTLEGWYTAASGGTKIFNADGTLRPSVAGYSDASGKWIKYDANVTVYAHWKEGIAYFNGSGLSSYLSNVTALDNIKRFEKYTGSDSNVQTLINNGTAKKIDDNTTEKSIYAWYDNGTVYWWTDAAKAKMLDKSHYLLRGLTNATYIDVAGIDTSEVTNMSYAFEKTGYNVTETFEIKNLSTWNTSKVTNMSYMFKYAGESATTWNIGNLSNWNTIKVTNMSDMFFQAGYSASTFNIGNLSNWNVSSVTNMSHMFFYAGRYATTWNIGTLTNWDVSSVTNMNSMFSGAGRSATTFNIGNLSSWDVSSVTNMSSMFNYAGYSASTFNIGNLSNWNVSNVTNMSYMFSYAGYSASTFNTGNLTNWDTSKVTNMLSMFNYAGYSASTFNIGNLSNWNVSNVTNVSNMFNNVGYSASTFNIGNLSNWDTSSVTNMSSMFALAGGNATAWSIGNLSNWNTSSVTNMESMFSGAGYNATTFNIGDLSNWNTSSVTNISGMFNYAGYNATTFNIGTLSNWNVSKVTSMSSMFECAGYKATTFNIGTLTKWNTSSVTNMSYMFKDAGCNATTWNSIGTLKVYATNIEIMFYDCSKAKATLNIYSNPTSYDRTFAGAATASGSSIKVNYSSATTNIDKIIATKSLSSNVTKGSQLD